MSNTRFAKNLYHSDPAVFAMEKWFADLGYDVEVCGHAYNDDGSLSTTETDDGDLILNGQHVIEVKYRIGPQGSMVWYDKRTIWPLVVIENVSTHNNRKAIPLAIFFVNKTLTHAAYTFETTPASWGEKPWRSNTSGEYVPAYHISREKLLFMEVGKGNDPFADRLNVKSEPVQRNLF